LSHIDINPNLSSPYILVARQKALCEKWLRVAVKYWWEESSHSQ